MRTVTARELMLLPEGTIYSWFEPYVCRGLYQKCETIFRDSEPLDFYEESLLPACEMGAPGELPRMGLEDRCRWGLFEYDALAQVYEQDDLAALQIMLTKAFQA